MSLALRILSTVGVLGAAILLLIGPSARRGFYFGWLRPRLVAIGLLVVAVCAALYVFRVAVVLTTH